MEDEEHSSRTSSADYSESQQSKLYDVKDITQKPDESPFPSQQFYKEGKLTEAELAHIDMIRKMAEKSSFDQDHKKSSEEKNSPGDLFTQHASKLQEKESISQPVNKQDDSQRDSEIDAPSSLVEACSSVCEPNSDDSLAMLSPKNLVSQVKNLDLSQEELAHFDRDRQLAEEFTLSSTVNEPSLEMPLEEEVVVEEAEEINSSNTSEADLEPISSYSEEASVPLLEDDVQTEQEEEIDPQDYFYENKFHASAEKILKIEEENVPDYSIPVPDFQEKCVIIEHHKDLEECSKSGSQINFAQFPEHLD
uniref:Uncharacterized protein n=1 Tax=Ditylenchus dipsaci TaxID=166011 RepID=A0A915CSB5_9BILA